MSHAEGLGPRLGPVLLQLPPTLRADPQLLDGCLACFPSSTNRQATSCSALTTGISISASWLKWRSLAPAVRKWP